MIGVMDSLNDRPCTACKSSNDRLRLSVNLSVTCFPEQHYSYFDSGNILDSNADQLVMKLDDLGFGTAAMFVCISLPVCQKDGQA
jgi:hypothetical protein